MSVAWKHAPGKFYTPSRLAIRDERLSIEDKHDKPPRTPDWNAWKVRPSATLRELCQLTLNISTSKGSIEALRKEKDARVKSFGTHLNTLRKWAHEDRGLSQVSGKMIKRFVQVLDEEPTSKTEYRLAPYVAWLRGGQRLPGVQPPPELLNMCSSISDAPLVDFVSEHSADAALPTATEDPLGLEHPNVRSTDAQPLGKSVSALASASSKSDLQEPLAAFAPTATRGAVAIGLLLMYIRHLATGKEPPPKSLLIGPHNRLNSSKLAYVLQDYLSSRTDLTTKESLTTASASPRTLRKTLGEGVRHFENDLHLE